MGGNDCSRFATKLGVMKWEINEWTRGQHLAHHATEGSSITSSNYQDNTPQEASQLAQLAVVVVAVEA